MTRTPLLGALAAAAAALVAAGCGSSSSTPSAAAISPAAAKTAPAHARVSVRSSSLGRHLVDSRGRTLYVFAKDRGHRGSTCFGACARNWPPLRSRGAAHAGRGVHASLLKTIHRRDGARQVTYRGQPLYEFTGDTRAGQTHGQGLNFFGGHWWIVSTSGHAITRKASAAPAPSPPPTMTNTVPTYGGY